MNPSSHTPIQRPRLAIIGAGPIGLEAAIYGASAGFDVQVYELGRIGEHLRRWGHVVLFSPWKINHSPLGARLLRAAHPTIELPAADALLTGAEMVERYYEPLARLPLLAGRIHTGLKVTSIGRRDIQKKDLIGDSDRANHPFRLLMKKNDGKEIFAEADLVIDASGVYAQARSFGEGGIPAAGERGLKTHFSYHIEDLTGEARGQYEGKRTLLLGSGYSAATSALLLARLAAEAPGTAVTWIWRHERPVPLTPIEGDALPERVRLTTRVNDLVRKPPAWLKTHGGTSIDSVDRDDSGVFTVGCRTGGTPWTLQVDRILANVGYEPDNTIYRELQVHECYATRGPMKLAAALLGETSADCLSQESHGADQLKNPEPGFFILGSKSYGTNSNFILKVGLDQIREIFTVLTGEKDFDLYSDAPLPNIPESRRAV